MKRLYITLGLLIAFNGYSQNKDTQKADKYYESYQYVAAIKEYESLVDKKKADGYVFRQLADSYYNIYNMDKAAEFYAKAIGKEKDQDAEVYYRYAQVLKSQGKYEEANKQMDKFAAKNPNDQRAKAHKANPNYVPTLQSKTKLFDVEQTKLGKAGASDFGAVLDNENMVYFVSNRGGGRKDRWTGDTSSDIYKAVFKDGTFSEPTAVKEVNTKWQEGTVAISSDGKTMFFTGDSHREREYENDKALDVKKGTLWLYKAVKRDGKWTDIKALPFNSTEYNVGSPSLSQDGKTLYFASDMPGGLGDTDIWKVEVKANDTYGDPVNLGNKVNTEGKENFPFIAEDGTLYFSSSGKPGFGGLDVFKLEANASEAQNLGKPVNSEKDDFAFTFNQKMEIGLFSSNRTGDDEIFFAKPICGRDADVVVKDAKTGEVLAGASVSILDDRKNVIKTELTSSQGGTSFYTECGKEYTLTASMKDYDPSSVTLAKAKGGRTQTEILLNPIEVVITETHVILNDIYFEFDKSHITEQGAKELDKLVKVMNDNPNMVIFVKSHTDTKGSDKYNQRLSEQRAQSTVQYVISKGISAERITGKGFGESEPKIDCKDNCTEEEDAQNRRSEFVIVKK